MFVAHEGWVDGAIGLAEDWPVVGVRSFRVGCCRDRDAQRTVALAPNVVHQHATLVGHKLWRPEASRGPFGRLRKDRTSRSPVAQVRGAV